MDAEMKEKVLLKLEDYAGGVVKPKAKEEVGRVLTRMKHRASPTAIEKDKNTSVDDASVPSSLNFWSSKKDALRFALVSYKIQIWANETVESEIDILESRVRPLRSIRSALPANARSESENDAAPAERAVSVVNEAVFVYLKVQGAINVETKEKDRGASKDTIIHWRRMSGFNALWVPGMNHAEITTQHEIALDFAVLPEKVMYARISRKKGILSSAEAALDFIFAILFNLQSSTNGWDVVKAKTAHFIRARREKRRKKKEEKAREKELKKLKAAQKAKAAKLQA
ncbi:hypothetical protein ACH5RR_024868 [Cinchona calisaya]|uniref:Uncharacterized protein n=1 Tax=Cinchona calisaya TaxID=153742 RepID=A0ABD2YY05_9GENT